MPFVKQTPRLLNSQNVEILNPNQNGVYGIFSNQSWIYVGKGDIKTRLLEHLRGDIPCILRYDSLYWVDEVWENQESMDNRERQLIIELNPICNQRIG
jgi:hypothetical protein